MHRIVLVLLPVLILSLPMYSACSSSEKSSENLDFETLDSVLGFEEELPALQTFEARDGARLEYRHYPGESGAVFILLHGSATDSAYLYPLANALSASGVADVYTPNLRGHGPSPERRGDIDYIEQLEDDLADLVEHVKTTNKEVEKVIIGGHSSGGGLAVRFSGGEHGHLASAYVLLTPYLGHDAPTVRGSSGGWASPSLSRIIPISMLNSIGITGLNHVRVLDFNLPPEYQSDSVTLSYSYRLMKGINPSDFRTDIEAMEVPLLILVGTEDETMVSSEFEPTVKPHAPHASIELLEGVSHLGIVADPETAEHVGTWMERL